MIDKGIIWLEKILALLDKYQIKTIFKALVVIVLISLTVSFVKNPTYIFERYKEWETEQHNAALEKRMTNSNKIQLLCEKLLYKVDAKRVVVLELHNGLTSNGNLPFAKCTATYESLNDGVAPVSSQYQNTNLSLMPFATQLFKCGYWCGDTKELENIDRGLFYKLMSNETEHFACCVIEGVDKPLALLMVSFDNETKQTEHSCSHIKEHIKHSSFELALLMEIKELNK